MEHAIAWEVRFNNDSDNNLVPEIVPIVSSAALDTFVNLSKES